MENLEDILKRLRDSSSVNGGPRPPDDNPVYTEQPEEVCEICDGRRWLTLDVPVGHPDFGKPEPCECQAEITTSERSERLRRYSNLGVLSRMTFDSSQSNRKVRKRGSPAYVRRRFPGSRRLRRRTNRLADSERPARVRQDTPRRRDSQPLHRTAAAPSSSYTSPTCLTTFAPPTPRTA